MAHPRDARNESLQCIALAMRQQLNRKIDENDLIDFMKWLAAGFPTRWKGYDRTPKRKIQKVATSDYNAIKDSCEIPDFVYQPNHTWSFIRWVDTEMEEQRFDPEADREFLTGSMRDVFDTFVDEEVELETPIKNSHLDDWTQSCVAIANKLWSSQYLKGKDYIFVMDGEIEIKKVAKDLLKEAANNFHIPPNIKRALTLAAQGSADKWNPADIFAVKKTFLSTLKSTLKTRKWETFAKNSAEIRRTNKNLETMRTQMRGNRVAEQNIRMQENMGRLYYYNQYIDRNYVSRECVPISLKKTSASSPPIKLMRHKEGTGVLNAVNLDLKITKVDYKPDAAKTIVEFTIAGKKGWMLDMRGFESGSGNKPLQDIQMQLQHGKDASHGKITLPVYSFIVKESKGAAAVKKAKAMRDKIFGHSFRTDSSHMFTPPSVFNDYGTNVVDMQKRTWPLTNKDRFNQTTLGLDAPLWAQYIEWLTSGRTMPYTGLGNNDVVRQFRKRLGDPTGSVGFGLAMSKFTPTDRELTTIQKNVSELASNWQRMGVVTRRQQGRLTTNDYKDAAKYLKNKVQSAEAGYIVDIARRNDLTNIIKNNIMKSAYTYAASKGLTIWGEMGGVQELVSSSTYVKVGG